MDSASCGHGTPIPGTQPLIDQRAMTGDSNCKSSDLILQPKPSTSPNDPLNFSRRRKLLNTTCWALYTFTNGFASSNLYSILTPLAKTHPDLTLSVLNAGTGYLFLLAGLGLLVWQPLALQYGKRPVYIISLIALLAMNLWGPYIQSEGQWYARSILSGFFASPIEALPEASVADLYFVHERGFYMGIYAMALIGSNFAAPIICGFIEVGASWQWVFYVSAVFCGVVAIFLFFAMEETNFDRGRHEPTSHTGSDSTPSGVELSSESKPRRKTYMQKLKLIDTSRPFTAHLRLGQQLLFLTWPIPFYAGFAYGSVLIWFNVLNATASDILSGPPHSFSPSIVGLSYVAPLIGVLFAFAFTGPTSDALLLLLSRRNLKPAPHPTTPDKDPGNPADPQIGTMEPEYRLPLLATTTLLIPFGLLLWGLGSAHHLPWPALLVAMACIGCQNAVGAHLTVTYLVDCYREAAGDALTAVILVRNVMSFAVNYGITPWIEGMGRERAFGLAAGVGAGASLFCLGMIWAGKPLRTRSAAKYRRLLEGRRRRGIGH